MKISTSARYGLLTVGYLARHKDEGIILSRTIAKNYKIPVEYLFKVMQDLARAQILRSKRGPNGGFWLAKPAAKITLLEVIEAIDGRMDASIGLVEFGPRDKFAIKATKAYDKTIAQARSALKKVKVSGLL